MDSKFHYGQEVMVFDRKGKYVSRGKVMGIHRCNPTVYDIQPAREESLAKRLCGMSETQLRPVGKPVLAYERRENSPMHIMDEA